MYTRDEAWNQLCGRYNDALRVWEQSPAVRDAAGTVGMDRRAYCESYIGRNYGPLVWANNATAPYSPLDADGAYRRAVILRAEGAGAA